MGKKFVHSTCGQPMVFNINEEVGNSKVPQPVKILKSIRIAGGAYVITKDSTVPKIAITEVDDEELELLEKNPAFQNMKRKGFITIHDVGYMEADSKGNPLDHEKKDNTSQILDEDHANGTDQRLEHDGTFASWGEGNQFRGQQPIASQTSDYGPIHIA